MTGLAARRNEAPSEVEAEAQIETELQEALVRLWTSAEARRDFLLDRDQFLDRLSLSSTARDRLLQLDAGQLETFATSLVLKRLAQVRELLADVAARLPGSFDDQFRTWAASHPPASTRHHEDDALRFGTLLLSRGLSGELRDRLRWRLLHLRLARPGWRIGLATFEFDVRETDLETLSRRFSIWIWWRGGTTRGGLFRLF